MSERDTLDARVTELLSANAALQARNRQFRETAYKTIDRFQDITGWQPGESRNALVCEIRDAVDAALAATEKEKA